jgi:hypothetical protein
MINPVMAEIISGDLIMIANITIKACNDLLLANSSSILTTPSFTLNCIYILSFCFKDWIKNPRQFAAVGGFAFSGSRM